ncbi:MAG TPA: hypothetical protein VLZ54_11860 [Arenibacter sp.]|nr:hypothetical protein [Arenibacter sp.]
MGSLTFDAVFEEAHESELVVTDNPVETGVLVSDHAYMAPLKLIISAGVSDTPLRGPDSPIPNDPFASDSAGRAQKAFDLLSELQKLAEPFEVQTGLKLYRNMVCTTIRTLQDKDTSGAFLFTATLREIIITYTQVVNYPPRKPGPTQRQASAKKTRGEQQSVPVEEKRKSALVKLLGFIKEVNP